MSQEKIRVGIFFGGPSREREISFAGGRTVYDNLNKTLFEPIPIFVDSHKELILLDWPNIYKGTIRDFYPPARYQSVGKSNFQIYVESIDQPELMSQMIDEVGQSISYGDLKNMIDFAFLALHGEFGEDGQLQGILEGMDIPYSGSGIMPSSIGMDKSVQKKLMVAGGFESPPIISIAKKEWLENSSNFYQSAKDKIGFPLVIRPANQGSSIGVSIISEECSVCEFRDLVDKSFFIKTITKSTWNPLNEHDKIAFIQELADIRSGLGFPVYHNDKKITKPEELISYLDQLLEHNEMIRLEAHWSEQKVILEGFIEGREFSCIVIRQENGQITALPPTEIVKGKEIFDYRSKYLPGLSRKITPIDLHNDLIENIRKECESLFDYLGFHVYARIDGFIQSDGTIILNDPNTTSGMMPSSFFFHQAAEIGLNPSQFLSFIVRMSLQERAMSKLTLDTDLNQLIDRLDQGLASLHSGQNVKKKIAVILGGYSFERHISVESGRNIFEKLASSDTYEPIPIFLIGDDQSHQLYQIPINLLLKDNADDIRDSILNFGIHPLVEKIKSETSSIQGKYLSNNTVFEPKEINYEELSDLVDGVFIALHGRPGEDGNVQTKLRKVRLPHNGSAPASASITIDKFDTLTRLRQEGFIVTDQTVLYKSDYISGGKWALKGVERLFSYPFIAKPVDDGCSSAVKIIRSREELEDFCRVYFRDTKEISAEDRHKIGLKFKEEFPAKEALLIEKLIGPNGAKHFLEITGGLLTRKNGSMVEFEMFEPSEALSTGDVLSLEEKFLAGEGQNITPARFSPDPLINEQISDQVKNELKRAAKTLGVTGYARIDAFVRIYEDNRVETIIIEVNSLPGMTPATCIFHQTALKNYKPYEFIDKILQFAFDEQTYTVSSE